MAARPYQNTLLAEVAAETSHAGKPSSPAEPQLSVDTVHIAGLGTHHATRRLLQLRYQTNQTCPFRGTLRVPSGTKPCRVPCCMALCATWYVAATLRQKGRTQSTSRKSGLSGALRDHMEYRMVFSPS